jgi:hypothetical protein
MLASRIRTINCNEPLEEIAIELFDLYDEERC